LSSRHHGLRGQVGQDLDTGKSVGIVDASAPADQAMRNIKIILAEAGAAPEQICKLVICITDPRYREAVYRTVEAYLKGVFPASTGIVSALARPEWMVEVDRHCRDPGRTPLTFSIAARCPILAGCCARCAHARAKVGVVAVQNITNPALGPRGLDILAQGLSAPEALAQLRREEPFIDFRQLTMVDTRGRSASHSGTRTLGIRASSDCPGRGLRREPPEAADCDHGNVLAAMLARLAAGGEEGPVH
jgi:enamine deaminase RidA (YjgF/YER057c/UK114 family)